MVAMSTKDIKMKPEGQLLWQVRGIEMLALPSL